MHFTRLRRRFSLGPCTNQPRQTRWVRQRSSFTTGFRSICQKLFLSVCIPYLPKHPNQVKQNHPYKSLQVQLLNVFKKNTRQLLKTVLFTGKKESNSYPNTNHITFQQVFSLNSTTCRKNVYFS